MQEKNAIKPKTSIYSNIHPQLVQPFKQTLNRRVLNLDYGKTKWFLLTLQQQKC